MSKISGGCSCGAVRYESDAEPILMLKCHCLDCQKATGGGHVCAMLFPAGTLRFTRGMPKYAFAPSAGGGKHKRGFCADCGSRLTGGENAERASGFVGINAGSLDDPTLFRPKMEIFVSDAQPWDYLDPDLPHYPEYPPS